jgi:hypothetical protein
MCRWPIGGMLLVLAACVCVCGSVWVQAAQIDGEGRLVDDPEAASMDARAMALYVDGPEASGLDTVLFDESDEESGARVIVLVSPARQPSPSEFDLKILVVGASEEAKFASLPTLHLVASDNSVELRGVWSINAYDQVGSEAIALPETTADDVIAAGAPPRRFTVDAGPVRPGEARFVRVDDEASGDPGSALARSIQRENYYDTYTIAGVGERPAIGYEYVIPVHVADGRLMARVIVSGIDWAAEDGATDRSSGNAAVAVDFEHDERAAARKRRADVEPSPWDIVHPGVIVRINSDAQGRKPYLRVDTVIRYTPDVAQANAEALTRLRGGEGKAIVVRGLLSILPTAEQIEADQLLRMDDAADAIRKAITEAGFPPPVRVVFSSWVIQG